MLEVHDLLVEDLNLAKISPILRFYERNRMCLGQDLLYRPGNSMTSVNVLVLWSGLMVRCDSQV